MLRTPIQCLLDGLSHATVAPAPQQVGLSVRDLEVALDTWLHTSALTTSGGIEPLALALAGLLAWWPRWHPQGVDSLSRALERADRPPAVAAALTRLQQLRELDGPPRS